MEDYISLSELIRQTGATSRQINYWILKGIILVIGEPNPGSGVQRQFDPSIIDKIKLLVKFSNTITNISTEILKLIYNKYDSGVCDFQNGISLTWEV